MNGLSRFCCSIGVLGAIGGGITLGIGLAQGGEFHRFVGTEQKQYQATVTEEQYTAYQLDGADVDLDISIISGNIHLVESSDEIFKIDYTYSIDETRVNFPNVNTPFEISEKNNTITWFQFDFLFDYDSEIVISVPSWFKSHIELTTINGDIVSDLKTYHEDIEISGVNTNITLNNIESSKNIDAKVVNGNVFIDASKFAAPLNTLVYEIESVNGDATINLAADAVYHYHFEKVSGDAFTDGASANEGMYINFKTVNGDLTINK